MNGNSKDKNKIKTAAAEQGGMDAKNKAGAKRLVIAALCCCGLLVLLLALNSIDFDSVDTSKMFGGRDDDEVGETYNLCEPNYDIDITYDTHYMARERYITFSDGEESSIISEYQNEYGMVGEFLLDYFGALTSGDAERYNSFFLDEYFDNEDAVCYERFTMQRVYDITVERISEVLIDDGGAYDGCIRTVYKVGYKIMHNDGTFRSDMPSDTVVPRLLETIASRDGIKISAIAKIKYK